MADDKTDGGASASKKEEGGVSAADVAAFQRQMKEIEPKASPVSVKVFADEGEKIKAPKGVDVVRKSDEDYAEIKKEFIGVQRPMFKQKLEEESQEQKGPSFSWGFGGKQQEKPSTDQKPFTTEQKEKATREPSLQEAMSRARKQVNSWKKNSPHTSETGEQAYFLAMALKYIGGRPPTGMTELDILANAGYDPTPEMVKRYEKVKKAYQDVDFEREKLRAKEERAAQQREFDRQEADKQRAFRKDLAAMNMLGKRMNKENKKTASEILKEKRDKAQVEKTIATEALIGPQSTRQRIGMLGGQGIRPMGQINYEPQVTLGRTTQPVQTGLPPEEAQLAREELAQIELIRRAQQFELERAKADQRRQNMQTFLAMNKGGPNVGATKMNVPAGRAAIGPMQRVMAPQQTRVMMPQPTNRIAVRDDMLVSALGTRRQSMMPMQQMRTPLDRMMPQQRVMVPQQRMMMPQQDRDMQRQMIAARRDMQLRGMMGVRPLSISPRSQGTGLAAMGMRMGVGTGMARVNMPTGNVSITGDKLRGMMSGVNPSFLLRLNAKRQFEQRSPGPFQRPGQESGPRYIARDDMTRVMMRMPTVIPPRRLREVTGKKSGSLSAKKSVRVRRER